jgi:energy-coupling factor transport system ATP-binding protein
MLLKNCFFVIISKKLVYDLRIYKKIMNAVEIKNLNYAYSGNDKSQKALTDINIKIEKGEFVALLGHNGSGKSTLAKLINGLLKPTEGEVLVFGMSTADESKLFEIRKNAGMVFQNPDNQMIATIVEDDIAFGAENIGLPREEIGKRIEFALNAVGMSEFRHSTPTRLSGGQKQRIAIAGVLAIKPNILILDESTAMLDPKGRKEVLQVVKDLNKQEKMTIILITHFMEEALEADRVIILNKGEVALSGTPEEIFNSEKLNSFGLSLPRAAYIAKKLKTNSLPMGTVLTAEQLSEELCRLMPKI